MIKNNVSKDKTDRFGKPSLFHYMVIYFIKTCPLVLGWAYKIIDQDGNIIGLSLIKQFIEVHNGSMWVEAQIGKGSTVYFSLTSPSSKE